MSYLYTNRFYHTYSKNIHSQNGEDGVIEEMLKRLDISGGWVCEVGAWDGVYLSSTFKLVKQGFKAVYIEGDPEKYAELLKTAENYNISPINSFINAENTLDHLLSTTTIPSDFDVLSIEIDSCDYQVWNSLKNYQPKIAIIQINSSIHTNVDYINDSVNCFGTGFKSMYELGIEKGYKFVLHTGNMIFIRNDLFDALNISYDSPLENFNTNWGGR
jgi:hypothetical protein